MQGNNVDDQAYRTYLKVEQDHAKSSAAKMRSIYISAIKHHFQLANHQSNHSGNASEGHKGKLTASMSEFYSPIDTISALQREDLLPRHWGDGNGGSNVIKVEDLYAKIKGATVVRLFLRLVQEIKGSQIAVDILGNPVARQAAKVSIRKVN